MKAHLHSARLAPKKMNIVAMMVRGMPVEEAASLLERTHKKAARLIEQLLKSAVANARHNDKQDPKDLFIKTIVVNQGAALRRGVPMARGRVRPVRKFMSHVDLALGVLQPESETPKGKKSASASQSSKKNVQRPTSSRRAKGSSGSSESSVSSASSS